MKQRIFFAIAFLMAVCSFSKAATKEAYAVYDESKKQLKFYYDSDKEGKTGETFPLNTGLDLPGWHDKEIVHVVFNSSFSEARPTTTRAWFEEQETLEAVSNLEYLNTSEVTDMGWMFYGCSSLKLIRTRTFDTTKVTNMSSMFCNCSSLTTLDLSSFNTSKVTDMTNMFYWCNSLETVSISARWNTSNVTESYNMFFYCVNIKGGVGTTYDEGHVNAEYARVDGGTNTPGYFSKETYAIFTESDNTLTFYCDLYRNEKEGKAYEVRDLGTPPWGTLYYLETVKFDKSFSEARPHIIAEWFFGKNYLTSIIGIKYLNTSEVTDMSEMFWGCTALTSIDLSNFDTRNVTNMYGMFSDCDNLETIIVGDGWNTDKLMEDGGYHMFYRCTILVGGAGTVYDASKTDQEYARIDGGTDSETPGYLTYKKPADITTGVDPIEKGKLEIGNEEWYTIDGQKLNGVPAKKGIYIQNGQKRIIK